MDRPQNRLKIIIKKSGIKYHHTHIYRILRKWEFRQKVPRKVYVNTTSNEEKNDLKKRPNKYLWMYISRSRSSKKQILL